MTNRQTAMDKSHTLNGRSGMQGFSLIEMMLSMLIGSIILAGIFTIFANTREAQRTMDQQLTMVSDARFAIELLTYDLRHASIYGGTNLATLVQCRSEDSSGSCPPLEIAEDCRDGWTHDLNLPVYSPSTDAEIAAYAVNSGCPIASHLAGTDLIEVRFVDTNPVADADIASNVTYIRSNYKSGMLFVGATLPTFSGDTLDSFTKNYRFNSRAYYISKYTDTEEDGIPSLRRIELQPGDGGPVLVDQLLMSGVEDLQVQFGVDTNNDNEIDKFVNAANITADSIYDDADADAQAAAKQAWSGIKAIKVWILVKAEQAEKNFNTASADGAGYSLGGFTIEDADLNDGYRRLLLSNVVRMRNMEYDAVVSTSTSTVTP